jgi:ATP-dependent helicase/nuclease subunit B
VALPSDVMSDSPSASPGSPRLELIPCGHGRDALDALRRVVSTAKADDPLAPVTVLVPSNFVGLSARRALAGGDHGPIVGSRPGMAGVTFSTVYRLAELLGSASLAATGRRPVSTPVIAAGVRQVLEAAPGFFERVAQHPTTERRLVAAHRDLSDLDSEELLAVGATSPRAADVVRVHRATRGRLAPDWYNEQDLVEAAINTIAGGSAAVGDLGAVIVFLPEHLSPLRAAFLRAIALVTPTAVVAALSGSPGADRSVISSLHRLGINPPSNSPPAAAPDLAITSVSDADDEVRHVIRGVIDAAREGVAFDRMAIVYASEQPYLRLLHDHLEAAGIARNGAAITTLSESAAGRLLRRLLALPDRDYRREEVAAVFSSPSLRWHQHTVPSRPWDLISRESGVVKGLPDWQHRLDVHLADTRSAIDDFGDDPEYEGRARHLRRTAEFTESLKAFVDQLATELRRGAGLTGWAQRANWCRRLLDAYLGVDDSWPHAERAALERLHRVLDRLASLDTVEAGADFAVFRRTLDLELESGLGRVGSFGNGVLVGSVDVTLGLALNRVWVVGLAEGSFPSRVRDDSLLPDREREVVEPLRLRRDRTGDEHRHLLAALASVGVDGRADLLYPRGDLRQSNERAPSRWLVEIAQQLSGDASLSAADLDSLDAPWLVHTPSFTAGVARSGFPSTSQEYELASLVTYLRTHGTTTGHELLNADTSLAHSSHAQAQRSSREFTRFDGNLAALGVAGPISGGRPTSATALETWARCPHQYFVRNLLGVDSLDTPELRVRIDPLSRGTLVHDILESFVQARIAEPADRRGWNDDDRHRLHEITNRAFAAVEARGLTGAALYWRRDQLLIRRDLDAFLAIDSERRIEQRLVPVATELGFGIRGRRPVDVQLPDGRSIAVRGSIDLVDETAEGDLVVIDYKTGARTPISEDEPHKNGQKLQLVLYANAARVVLGRPDATVDSRYWHIRAKDKYATAGYVVTPRIEAVVLDAVATIVDGIEQGVFPQHPDTSTRNSWISCHFCDPDGLGTSEARRRLGRMADDPSLASFLSLAEPKLGHHPRLPGTTDA